MHMFKENCVFCKIIKDEAPSEKIYQDEDIICIKDIYPASTHHYLIIPKTHIKNAKELQPNDSELYEKMVCLIDVICEMQNLNPENTRSGFHWPPFTTVDHLHLHVISPIENMSMMRKMMFEPNSLWFVSTDYVRSRLKSNSGCEVV